MLTYPEKPVIIVDDEEEILIGFEFILNSSGITNIRTFADSRSVMPFLSENQAGVILLDLSMPGLSGEELLGEIRRHYPAMKVIIITGFNDVDTAVACMKKGAFDYLVKPVENERLVSATRRALTLLEEETEYRGFRDRILKDRLIHPEAFSHIITQNKSMRAIFQYAETIATTGKPVLLTGESGVGKGLLASAIHALSGVKGKFITVNIAGLDDHLFSDTLYGHVKGAFTGAISARSGLVEQAADGTLFLDEIGELHPQSQVKLLRLLEDREYFPLGSDTMKQAMVRVITATNRDISELKAGDSFRSDLYYRLETHNINIPPLRDRPEDIPLLLDHLLEESAKSLGRKKPTPPPELYDLLMSYHFPGNVREFQSMVFDAVSHHPSKMLSMERFRMHIQEKRDINGTKSAASMHEDPYFGHLEKLPTLREARRRLIREALRRSNDSSSVAAGMLGISRSGLNKIL